MNKFEEMYEVKEIDYDDSKDIIHNHHYLKRRSTTTKTYGMIRKEDDKLIGVCSFGNPASRAVCVGVCGHDEAENVKELKRLYIFDETPKNAESWFIGKVFKLVPYEIILSFSEPKVGHKGVVYQSTNFLFCGATIPFREYVPADGRHPKTIHGLLKQYGGGKKAYEALGEEVIKIVDRDRKYRYVFFNATKKRKKELMQKLRYDVYEYPKTFDIEEWEQNKVVKIPTKYKRK